MKEKKHRPYPESKLIESPYEHPYGTVWGTLDGQWVKLKNMRYSHLLNVEKHIQERHHGAKGMLPYIQAEIRRREQMRLARKSKAGKILYGKAKKS